MSAVGVCPSACKLYSAMLGCRASCILCKALANVVYSLIFYWEKAQKYICESYTKIGIYWVHKISGIVIM